MEKLFLAALFLVLVLPLGCAKLEPDIGGDGDIAAGLVLKMAESWKTGDVQLLYDILHEDAVFAYPGRRLTKSQAIEDLIYFRDNFKDTEVYINKIIIDSSMVAVEWQFAATNIQTGERQVVSDGIIGEVKGGKIIVWKEYLDGRVKTMQASGELAYEEGLEPYPWPQRVENAK